MDRMHKLTDALYYIGVLTFFVGSFDPLEGSVVIAIGSVLMAITTLLLNDRHRKIFLASSVLIVWGVILMNYLSSLGGFGGESALSWWWAILILPYPAGWIITVITLIVRLIHNRRELMHSVHFKV